MQNALVQRVCSAVSLFKVRMCGKRRQMHHTMLLLIVALKNKAFFFYVSIVGKMEVVLCLIKENMRNIVR